MTQQNGTAPDPLSQLGTPAQAAPAPADPLASMGTPAVPPPAASTPEQPGLGSRIWEGAKQFAAPFVNAVKPAETPTEHLIELTAGDGALAAYRAAGGLVASAEKMVKAGPAEYKQALDDFKRMHQEFSNKDYRNAASSAVSTASDVAGIVDPIARGTAGDIRELSEGARPGGNLATPLTRQGLGAATALIGGEASKLKVNPFRQIMEGKAVAQESAEAAVRGGVQASADTAGTASPLGINKGIATNPLVESINGSETILDEPLDSLASMEQAHYKAIDKTAGFDLKEAKLQLKNDQYNLKQLGNTPEDIAKAKTLKASIADSTQRIGDAEAKLTKAGIDPKAGDAVHMSRMAGEDFKKILIRNTATDGTVDVDKLLKDSKALRFNTKYGDRLEQFMGKAGADSYIEQLQAAQKAGVHAMKVQKIAKWVGGLAATAAGLGIAGEGVKLLSSGPGE